VDLCRSERTVEEKLYYIKKFLNWLEKPFETVTREDVRAYLKAIDNSKTAKYINTLKSLKVFFRDFLESPEIVKSFRFPKQVFKPKPIPSREDLQRFYKAIESDIGKTLFLMYATTGLRKNEVLSLKLCDVDFKKRMVTPNCHSGRTKKSYVSFYNEETEKLLTEIVEAEKDRLFSISDKQYRKIWKEAGRKTDLKITAQRLREWFCEEMSRLGVSDRFIDAFCGRVPKSVLAKHYSDYSPEKLKQIYDKANLKILS